MGSNIVRTIFAEEHLTSSRYATVALYLSCEAFNTVERERWREREGERKRWGKGQTSN